MENSEFNKNFENFWIENQMYYKEQAKKDFNKVSKGVFVCNVSINTDDDFSLDIGTDFEIFGNSKKEIREMLIKKLENAKFTYCKTWGRTDEKGETKGDYSNAWFYIRDESIKMIKNKNEQISFGGNQTIEIDICDNNRKELKFNKSKLK
jgi:hypothetical protein